MLAKQELDEYSSHRQLQNVSEFTTQNSSVEAVPDTNHWSYGTEQLLDALPKPWTRSLLYTLVVFTAIVLPWSILSKVDETGSARGRIEPLGATQKLDSQAGGKVTSVLVKEGQIVRSGQVLVKLESDVLQTNLQQVQAKLDGQFKQETQLHLLKNQLLLTLRTQEQQNEAQKLEKWAQVEQARQNLHALKTGYNLQKQEKLSKVDQVRHAIEASKATLKLAQLRLEGAQEKVPRYRRAFNDGAIPQDRLLDVEESAKETYQNVIQANSEVSRAQSSLVQEKSSYQETIHRAEAEIQQAEIRLQEQQRSAESLMHASELTLLKIQQQLKDLQSQLTAIESEMAQTKSQIISLKFQLEQRVVRSPINGVIFELPISKPGAVVQPGQRIAQIAPNTTAFILRAEMPIQNSGFLKVGSRVKIKFDAYPFQEYGIASGHVRWISPDSKIQETNQGKIATFELEIALDQSYLESWNKRILLSPGQTATAEVIIRQRRVIDYMLDPFKKLQKGGLEM